jgi:hypothetical protein
MVNHKAFLLIIFTQYAKFVYLIDPLFHQAPEVHLETAGILLNSSNLCLALSN